MNIIKEGIAPTKRNSFFLLPPYNRTKIRSVSVACILKIRRKKRINNNY